MAKRLKVDEALSNKINTLPEDFMKYLEGSEERFLKEMQEHDFKLVKALTNKKIINGITVSSYVFGNITQNMIQGVQDVLKAQNMCETTIVTSGYGVSKLSVRYSELSKELSICYQDADRLQITKDDYRFYSTSKNGYALEFYPSYKKKCDGSDCTGGVNIEFKSGKKVPFSTAFASVLCSENNTPIGWFVREFYKYLSTISELYLFKDFQREADFLNDFSVYESKAINLSLEDIFRYRTKDDWFHAHLAKKYQNRFNRNMNKYSLEICSILLKGQSYFNDKEIVQILDKFQDLNCLDLRITESGYINKELAGKMILSSYYKYKLFGDTFDNNEVYLKEHDNYTIIEDYIDMTFDSHEENHHLNIKSMNRLIREHDELVQKFEREVYEEDIKNVKVKKNSVFNHLATMLPEDQFEWIRDGERLFREGHEQHNCVVTYASCITDDDSAIYSAVINGHRYTIEFVYHERFKTYEIAQMFLACNKEAFQEDVEYLNELLLPNFKKEMEQIHVPVNSRFNALQVQLPENFLWLQNGESIYRELKGNYILYNDVKYWVCDDYAAVYTACIDKVDYVMVFGLNDDNKYTLFNVWCKNGKKVAKSISNQIEKLIQNIQPAS